MKLNGIETLELCFVVDVTGSMGSFIREAQTKVKSILDSVASKGVNLRVSIVKYRDHCDSQVTKKLSFTTDMDKVQKFIKGFRADGGGDYPEAVLDALQDCANSKFTDNSTRLAILIADAPPHGCDENSKPIKKNYKCKCGKTFFDTVSIVESKALPVYSINVSCHSDTDDAFKIISNFTGGKFFKGGLDSARVIEGIVNNQVKVIKNSEKIVEYVTGEKITDRMTIEELTEAIKHVGIDKNTFVKLYNNLITVGVIKVK